jgi:hypothetical protein
LLRDEAHWQLVKDATGDALAHVTIPPDIAWRIFTKGISYEAAQASTHCVGDQKLGLHVLRMLSIVG